MPNIKQPGSCGKPLILSRQNFFSTLFLLFAVGILFYFLNYFTPYYADDYSFLNALDGKRGLVHTGDIVPLLKTFYLHTNGRVILHAIAYFFYLFDKAIFNVVNVFVFLGLGILISYHGTGHRPASGTLLFTYCSLFLLIPHFGESFLWLDGACNYMYGICIILLYLLPYRLTTGGKKSCPLEILRFSGMSILGFLAGATNENTSIALITIVLAYLLYFRLYKIKLRAWMLSPGPVIGCLFMLLAPGQQLRLENTSGLNLFLLVKNLLQNSANLFGFFWPLILLSAGGLWWSTRDAALEMAPFRIQKYVANKVLQFFLPSIYLLGFLASVYSPIVVPGGIPLRSWSGPLSLLLIFTISFFHCTKITLTNWTKNGRRFLLCILAISTLAVYFTGFIQVRGFYKYFSIREDRIQQCAIAGETAQVPALCSPSKYSVFYLSGGKTGDLSHNPTDWLNTAMAQYYGVPQIIRDDSLLELLME